MKNIEILKLEQYQRILSALIGEIKIITSLRDILTAINYRGFPQKIPK